MTRRTGQDPTCDIARAVEVIGESWSLLILRDVAGGIHRFDPLRAELGVSRTVLADRLARLVEHGVLEQRAYCTRPPRWEYHLTVAGRGLLPVLVGLQDWGARFGRGDGTLSATAPADSPEARRVRGLVGLRVPPVHLRGADGRGVDPIEPSGAIHPSGALRHTVLYCFPGAGVDAPGWAQIPGAPGCTLESRTFRDRVADFATAGAAVVGVSTQRPDQLAAFGSAEGIGFPLLSDEGLELAGALRLPTFRAGGVERLKRVTLVIGADRVVEHVLYPVPDPAASVSAVLDLIGRAVA